MGYNIDEKLKVRLVNAMNNNPAMIDRDVHRIKESMSAARNPPGLLTILIREMETRGVAGFDVCHDFQNGRCARGESCRFSHVMDSSAAGVADGPAAAVQNPGVTVYGARSRSRSPRLS